MSQLRDSLGLSLSCSAWGGTLFMASVVVSSLSSNSRLALQLLCGFGPVPCLLWALGFHP